MNPFAKCKEQEQHLILCKCHQRLIQLVDGALIKSRYAFAKCVVATRKPTAVRHS